MRETGFLFKEEMVRAILEDRKWVTRRLVNPQPNGMSDFWPKGSHTEWQDILSKPEYYVACGYCKYGQPGDVMYVKETWMPFDVVGHDYDKPAVVIGYKASNDIRPDGVSHEEFGASKTFPVSPEKWRDFRGEIERMEAEGDRWHPSIFMPRWASRIQRKIISVRPERLQDITEAEAKAEGVDPALAGTDCGEPLKTYRTGFVYLWNRINPEHPWSINPWIWRIEFERK